MSVRRCPGDDPTCPCQDGDTCHYEELDAWPVPEPLPAAEKAKEGSQVMDEEQNYCGCCGNEIGRSTRSDPLWCNRCARHVARSYRGYTRLAPWEQTYRARTGEPCPFAVWAEPTRET